MRLDVAIVEKYGYSRNKAQSFIQDGLVSVNQRIILKPSLDISESDIIDIRESPVLTWVSRSAGKLEGFFSALSVGGLSGKKALDIGSSTGGFTQILLAHDIDSVISVDVGDNQLHPDLRNNPKVVSYENTDIRSFVIQYSVDIITIDVSFISLYEIVPLLHRFATDTVDIYMLYKPQFEVGRKNLRKTGVPRDEKIVGEYLSLFLKYVEQLGYKVQKVSPSTVIGEAGNQEYMIYIIKI